MLLMSTWHKALSSLDCWTSVIVSFDLQHDCLCLAILPRFLSSDLMDKLPIRKDAKGVYSKRRRTVEDKTEGGDGDGRRIDRHIGVYYSFIEDTCSVGWF